MSSLGSMGAPFSSSSEAAQHPSGVCLPAFWGQPPLESCLSSVPVSLRTACVHQCLLLGIRKASGCPEVERTGLVASAVPVPHWSDAGVCGRRLSVHLMCAAETPEFTGAFKASLSKQGSFSFLFLLRSLKLERVLVTTNAAVLALWQDSRTGPLPPNRWGLSAATQYTGTPSESGLVHGPGVSCLSP